MKELVIVGGGPGHEEYMLPAGVEAIRRADLVVADQRFMYVRKYNPNVLPMVKVMDTIDAIGEKIQDKNIAVVVSGDPLLYSLYKTICRKLPHVTPKVIPGVGSFQMFASILGETLEGARLLSLHGRNLSDGALIKEIRENEKVFFLCDKIQTPSWIAGKLTDAGLGRVHLSVGCNLSYEDQVIDGGAPDRMTAKTYDGLCVVLVKNPNPGKPGRKPLLMDNDFIRGKTPMTKEEIRWTILGKMRLFEDSTVWDVGAGTGSISIECARQCPYGQVHSVERSPEAVSLIRQNKEKFGTENLIIHEGDALDTIKKLPVPTHVFIGGSGKEMEDILKYVCSLGKGIKVMAACVTIETISETTKLLSGDGFDNYDIIQLAVSRSREIGRYHILDSNNPVMLVSAVTKERNTYE